MRFDEYLAQHDIPAVPVDSFPGYLIEVDLPTDWQPVDAVPGVPVWAWMADPNIDVFCANTVLTLHRLPVAIDPTEVFAMLCEQQLHMLAGSVERHRSLNDAPEGPGIIGVLQMRIPSEHGTLDSTSTTRVLNDGEETFIAQLTLTALPSSPVGRAGSGLTVAVAQPAVPQGGAPVGLSDRRLLGHAHDSAQRGGGGPNPQ